MPVLSAFHEGKNCITGVIECRENEAGLGKESHGGKRKKRRLVRRGSGAKQKRKRQGNQNLTVGSIQERRRNLSDLGKKQRKMGKKKHK